MRTLQPAGWPRPKGYVNGIAAKGEMVFVAGQIGWDETETVVSDALSDQAAKALENTVAVLAEAGAGPEHVVRMTWYVTDKHEYLGSLKAIGAAWKKIMGANFPAMALVQVSALVEDAAKVEIETTAVIPE